MGKRMRKILSVVLAVLMLMSAVPLTAGAAEIIESGSCGTNLTYTLDANGTLTVSGTGAMKNYGYRGSPWYSNRSLIKNVVIENGVTSIAYYAFQECSSLESIDLPEGLSSIGYRAFSYCSSLESIEIPSSVTSIVGMAFSGCSSLTSIKIPSSVTSVGDSTFQECSSLTSIEIPSTVTSIGENAFYKCSSLASIELPEAITEIGGYAFADCSSLTSIEIPDGVTSIGSFTFSGCSSLTSIEIPEGVTSIDWFAFSGCSSLTSIELPEGLTSIGEHAFYGCSSLTSIEIPDGVTSIGECAFFNCSSLERVEISDLDAWCNIDFGDSYSNPLYYVHKLYLNGEEVTEVVFPEEMTAIKPYVLCGGNNITSVEIPSSVTSIGSSAFEGCSSLTSIEIPSSVTSIGGGAFSRCSSLESIKIPEGVSSIGYSAFSGCNSLARVDISDLDAWCNIDFGISYSNPLYFAHKLYLNGEEVTEVVFPEEMTEIKPYVLCGGNNITSVEIPSSVTSIGSSAFEGCSSLTSIEIPSTVTSIGENAFYKCSSLERVEISDLDAWCNIDFVTDYSNPLYYAHKLYLNGEEVTEVVFPEGITEVKPYVFLGAANIVSVELPEGVTSIGECAFCECSSLESIEIPEGITSIGSYAFYECNSLESIEIPSTVTSIGENAFYKCSSLERVDISDLDAWCNIDFDYYGANPLEYAHKLYLNGEEVTEVVFPEGITEVKPYVFCGAANIVSVELPEGITSIGYRAFSGCSSLESIELPEGITSIGSYAFYECRSLTSIEIPDGVTSIGECAFFNCSSLETIYMSAGIETIGLWAFSGCQKLSDVYFYGTQAQWNEIIIEDGNDYLLNATIHFNCGDEGYEFDSGKCGDDLYWELKNDNTLRIWGSGAMYDFTSDAAAPWVKFNCIIKEIVIEYGATNIGDAAFRNCNMFSEIYMPDSIKDIGESSFAGCRKLSDVYFAGTEETWNKITVGEDNEPLLNATIHFNVGFNDACDYSDKCEMTATVLKNATCTQPGETKYQCVKNPLHYAIDRKNPPATGHKLDNGTVTKAATCTENGEILYKCTVSGCGYEKPETINKIAHSEKLISGYEPTCEEAGLSDKKICSVCGNVVREATELSALGHNEKTTVVTAPTCMTSGKNVITCEREGCDYETTEYPEALGHNSQREEVITAPTCLSTGTTRLHCTNSGCTYYENKTTAALGHDEKRETVTEPTCLESGLDKISCNRAGCAYSATETVPALGHNPVPITGFAAQCESNGLSDGEECSRCHTVFVTQQVIPATGHSWDEGKVTTEPTCQSTGVMTYTCQNNSTHTYTQDIPESHVEETIEAIEPTCEDVGYTEGKKCSVCDKILEAPNEVAATGHSWNSGTITKKASCTENGVKTFTCKNDNTHTYDEVIPATGHKEKALKGHAATCLEDGLTDGVGCENCNAVFTAQKTIPATGHDWDDGVVTENPTCSKKGTILYTCKNDASHTDEEDIEKLPHSEMTLYGYAATCTENGLTDGVKCSVCGTFTVEQEVISRTGHDYQFDSVIVERTCAVEGFDKYVCKNDASHTDRRSTGTDEHNWDNGQIIKEASCTEFAEILYTCTGCGKTKDGTGAKKAHSYKETLRVEPTCTQDGYYILSCETCDDEQKYPIHSTGHFYGDDDICDICGNKADHKHSYSATVVSPTCTSSGYTLYYCECGDSYKSDFTDITAHSYSDPQIILAASCYSDGLERRVCTVCGDAYDTIITANHNWVTEVVVEPTCTKEGYGYKRCTVCNKKEFLLLTDGHKWSEAIENPAPTCTTDGNAERECTVCHEKDSYELTALGHSFVDGVCSRCGLVLNPEKEPSHPDYSMYFMVGDVYTIYGQRLVDEYGVRLQYNKEASFRKVGIFITQEGTRWKRVIACTGDDITSLYAVPYLAYEYEELYSPYTTELINLMPMTKNRDGIWTYNDYQLTDVNLVDRNWDPIVDIHNIGYAGEKTRVFTNLEEMIKWLKEDSDCIEHIEAEVKGTAPTCTQPGLTDGTECSVCGIAITEQEIIAATGHTPITVEGTAPTCTQTGLTDGTKCSVCDFVIKAQETVPLARHTEITVNGKAPTCTQTGLTDGKQCSACGVTIKAQQVIAASGHKPVVINEKAPQIGVAGYTGDTVCSECGELLAQGSPIEPLDPADTCSHICHKTGFVSFFWKIALFFNKLFKINSICECGAAHY